jgi:hypothetical protein
VNFAELASLLKNSLCARFDPRWDPKYGVFGTFGSFWSRIRGRFQLNADFFNSVPWPLLGHPEAMKMSCCQGYFHCENMGGD